MIAKLALALAYAAAALHLWACRSSPPDAGYSGRLKFPEAGGKVWVEAYLLDSTLRVLSLRVDSADHQATRCEDWKLGEGKEADLRALIRPRLRPGYRPFRMNMDTVGVFGLVVLLRGGDSTYLFVDSNPDSPSAYLEDDSIMHSLVDPLRSLFTSRSGCPEGHYLFLYPVPSGRESACRETSAPPVLTRQEAARNGYADIFARMGRYSEFPAYFGWDPGAAENLTQRLYETEAGCRGTLVRTYRDGAFQDNRL